MMFVQNQVTVCLLPGPEFLLPKVWLSLGPPLVYLFVLPLAVLHLVAFLLPLPGALTVLLPVTEEDWKGTPRDCGLGTACLTLHWNLHPVNRVECTTRQ